MCSACKSPNRRPHEASGMKLICARKHTRARTCRQKHARAHLEVAADTNGCTSVPGSPSIIVRFAAIRRRFFLKHHESLYREDYWKSENEKCLNHSTLSNIRSHREQASGRAFLSQRRQAEGSLSHRLRDRPDRLLPLPFNQKGFLPQVGWAGTEIVPHGQLETACTAQQSSCAQLFKPGKNL